MPVIDVPNTNHTNSRVALVVKVLTFMVAKRDYTDTKSNGAVREEARLVKLG